MTIFSIIDLVDIVDSHKSVKYETGLQGLTEYVVTINTLPAIIEIEKI